MNKLKNIGSMRNGNLWINEKIDISFVCIDNLKTTIKKNEWIHWDDASYILEFNLNGRNANNYALLGITYMYQESDELIINVNVSDYEGKVVSNTLALRPDEVHSGIPLDYAREIICVAEDYFKHNKCGTGVITFDIGAHGYIGSSTNMFSKVSRILLQILTMNDKRNLSKMEDIVSNMFNVRKIKTMKRIWLDEQEFIPHIPKFPKLEKVVPLPFHEKTNQFIIDYKALSEKALWEKYNLKSVWFDVKDYVVASKKHGTLGLTIINVLVDFGFILQLDYREELSDYNVENFWGEEPVKLVQFDLENDQCYYAYIPQITDLKSIFDVKIYEVSVGDIEQGGLDMGGLK